MFHFQRNDFEDEVHAVEQYRPALQMQEFFEVLTGWANDGKTNERGLPTPLRSVVMHRYFKKGIRSSSTRRNLSVFLLAPLGRTLGYQTEVNSVNDGFGERIVALSYCAMCRSIIPFDEKTLELLRDAKTCQCQKIFCRYDFSDARER